MRVFQIQLKLSGSKLGKRKRTRQIYHRIIPAANLMCPPQTPVTDKHSHQPAACLVSMIYTFYTCSTLGSVDTDACWTSIAPPIQTKRAYFLSQTLLLHLCSFLYKATSVANPNPNLYFIVFTICATYIAATSCRH